MKIFIAIAVVCIVVLFVSLIHTRNKCRDDGGVLVRGVFEYVCVKIK